MNASSGVSALLTSVALSVVSFSACAVGAVFGQGTWETSLEARDFGSDGTIDAYYDRFLDITWLKDANFAATSGQGDLTFTQANAWAGSLRLFGSDDWRLPTATPVNGSTFNSSFRTNGSTDAGYARTGEGWGKASEMGYMYYVHLGNKGRFVPNDGWLFSPQDGFGLSNTGPFENLQPTGYWTDRGFPGVFGSTALAFDFEDGRQGFNGQVDFNRAWAVHSGDLLNRMPRADQTFSVEVGDTAARPAGSRLEVGLGDLANGQPALRVAGTFLQEGGLVDVEGDAEVTGLFSARGWDDPTPPQAPVIDIDGTLTVAGTGRFEVFGSVPGARVELGNLVVSSRRDSIGQVDPFGITGFLAGNPVSVDGTVTVTEDGAMRAADLTAGGPVTNHGLFFIGGLRGAYMVNTGDLIADLERVSQIDGYLANSGTVWVTNGEGLYGDPQPPGVWSGRELRVLGGVQNEVEVTPGVFSGGQFILGGGSRLITPTFMNDNRSGLIWSIGDNNVIKWDGCGFVSEFSGFVFRCTEPTPDGTEVFNRGIIRVDGGTLTIDGSLIQNGSVELNDGDVAQLQPNSVFQASAAGAQAEAAAEGPDADAPSAEPMLLTAVAHATPVDTPTLEVSGDFTLGAGGRIDAVAGSVLRVGGSFTSEVSTPQDLSTLTLTFFGEDAHLLTAAGDITFGGLDVSGDGSVRIAREAGANGDLRIAFATTLTAALFGRLDADTGVGLLFAAIDPRLLDNGPLRLAGGGSIALLDNGVNPIPLPAAFWLLSSGAAALLATRRRRAGRVSARGDQRANGSNHNA